MNPRIVFRLIVYFATIALLAVLIVWTAIISWVRIGELQDNLSAQQWKSFQIADHLQQVVLDLNNKLLRYTAYEQEEDWTNFAGTGSTLGDWITQQRPIVTSGPEQSLFDQIKTSYTNYLSAANTIHTRIYGDRKTIIHVEELADFEKYSRQMLAQGYRLAELHQESLESFQKQTAKSLEILRATMLGSLLLLLVSGCWLTIVVYREMIAPLQMQLIESRQLVQQQEKLASLGLLAAGVAHEVRNPLTAIKAWLFLQQKHLKCGTPEYADAEVIGAEINRLERIVRDFLHFARPSEPDFAVVSAEEPLREVQTLLGPDLEKSRIKLVVEKADPMHIRIDPQQIKQVLLNLIRNAADSIGEDGTVTLRARSDEKRINDRQTEVVILEVSDNGRGISPDAEKRLFDPFFTTKDFGTGLGLPIAARIVEKHHGALQYRTQLDFGTTFGIILPLYKA